MSRAQDERYMKRALALAARGGRAVFPNPKVGCVLVKDGRIVGEGWHRKFGGPHAELLALARAGEKARGATAYVNLEPCHAHPGKKTPPCSPALAEAGVARVVVAVADPHPGTDGRGLKLLKRTARVSVGAGAKAAEALNADFLARMRRMRPRVLLKTALSLDGRAAADGGKSKWITGEKARAAGRKLRAQCDAVLVGVGTILADNPSLTARVGRKEPLRVVLDSRLRSPARAKIFDGKAKTLVFSKRSGKRPHAEIVKLPAMDVRLILWELARRGVNTVLVEGGPTVHASFLAAGVVDEAAVFLAPKLLAGSRDPNACPRMDAPRFTKLGPDYLVLGPLRNP